MHMWFGKGVAEVNKIMGPVVGLQVFVFTNFKDCMKGTLRLVAAVISASQRSAPSLALW